MNSEQKTISNENELNEIFKGKKERYEYRSI